MLRRSSSARRPVLALEYGKAGFGASIFRRLAVSRAGGEFFGSQAVAVAGCCRGAFGDRVVQVRDFRLARDHLQTRFSVMRRVAGVPPASWPTRRPVRDARVALGNIAAAR